MDQILDRFERLVRSWVSSALGDSGDQESYGSARTSFEDQDLADAWDELESYLDPSKTKSERVQRKYRASAPPSKEDIERRAIEDAYRFLGLEPYTAFPLVKTRYKELLMKHHPDRHAGSPEEMKKATEISAKINTAYQLIEAWEESKSARRP